ncbi:MAG: membrane protein insertase YidC [Candidatus Kaiserbacteria bacterium]|nr:membrane protein insertase YidC [Candidatus Kaiserbacteria bacterium]MCB9816502.1 membrane protein insertase YidC [Candidatus Nomurabacteria bacterium]
MFSWIWHTFFFDPVYNALVFFIDVIPGGDVGLAIIATILLVKTVLLPISIKAVKTQKVMQEINPKIKEIKEKYKDDRQLQAQEMMKVYQDAGMNPLASIFLMFIQIPIIISLYFSVYSGGGVALPDINLDILYSFVAAPLEVTMNFLGHFDITQRSLLLALGAGVTQFIHVNLTMPKLPPKEEGAEPDMKEDFMRNMQTQMKYVMPVLIFFVAYSLSATIALYFVVSNLVTIGQEYFIRKHR